MIKQFDRQTVKNLRTELDEVLADFAKKHGIAIQMGSARFTATTVNWKLNMVCPAAAGNGNVADSVEGVQFLANCALYGLDKTDLNEKVMLRGVPHTIVGMNTRRHKYPIICENNNGTRYCYAVHEIKQALLAKKMAAAGG